MSPCNKKIVTKTFVILFLVIAAVFVYHFFNPEENSFFPACIFHSITGYKCPGCGTQRCLHYLLNGEIMQAFKNNALFLCALPFIVYGTVVSVFKNRNAKWQKLYKISFSLPVVITIGVITVMFTVFRNICGF